MTLKLIQVGLGAHGEGLAFHFISVSKDFTFAGLVEINRNKLAECSKALSVPEAKCYTDYRQAFSECSAEAVLVTAASPYHYEICKAALEYNLHVLVEKPFVLDMVEACELVDLADSKNLVLMVNQNYRYYRNVSILKQAIHSVGKPLFVQIQFYYDHFGKDYQKVMDNFMLLEMAVHHIDMMRFLFDCNIHKVSGKTWNIPGGMYQGDPNVHAIYEMENGTPIFYLGSLVSKGQSTPWEGIWRIQCEFGSVHLDDLGEGYGVYVVDQEQKKKCMNAIEALESGEGVHGVLAEFAECIRERRVPSISGKDNLNTLAALFATSDSSKHNAITYPGDYIRKNLNHKERDAR